MPARAFTRCALALFYGVAGVFHLAMPAPFLTIMPAGVPAPELMVQLTGWAELAGAAALLQGWSAGLRRAGGWGLAAYALCVWPANINHMLMDMANINGGRNLAYHIPRMLAQPVLIWAALWAGGVTDWPWRRR
ncbi:membrane protein [Croceibacterium mercuriale]|uniref:Membrane protein n=1 Tax=Croceibacterium mercuriale TaxID=1572751 RepID=A0A0B2BZ97_9SPHN|nr:membrane protein [Croceibacterium mercuriale]KHL25347.1 membrane protein [Croceibacterium mercuriale]